MSARVLPFDEVAPRRPVGTCRYCTKPTPKGRTRWCSDACNDAARFLTHFAAQRRAVEDRDHGVCALCGLDTDALHAAYRYALVRWSKDVHPPTLLKALGFVPSKSLWEADHTVPVVEGGGVRVGMTREEVLAGLRTLCCPCHRRETAALAGRRAARRREAVQPALIAK